MTITPDQARELLDANLAPGPYYVEEDDWEGDIFGNAAGHSMSFAPQLRMKVEGKEGGELALFAAAPDMAETIAGMKWEWGIERDWKFAPGGRSTLWFKTEAEARKEWSRDDIADVHPRLVRRLVGPVEVIDGE